MLVAADVIYSDDLIDALFTTLERLMSHGLNKVPFKNTYLHKEVAL